MALRILIGLVVGAMVLRFAPALVLRLLLLLPRPRVARTVRLVRTASSATRSPLGEPDHPILWMGIGPVKLVLVSSSLLALMALIATAVLK